MMQTISNYTFKITIFSMSNLGLFCEKLIFVNNC